MDLPSGAKLVGTNTDVNSVNVGQYYQVPKADGGFDWYRAIPGEDGVYLTSQQDTNVALSGAIGNPTQNEDYTPSPTNNTTGTSLNVAGERAAYDDQINTIDTLLGTVGAQRQNGLNNLNTQKSTIMTGYDTQKTQNTQNKQRGVESVDAFANNSYNSLQRLLQGAGAGNSSVSQSVVPQLVSRGAGTRRQGVFQTAGENEQNIDQAINSTEAEFGNEKDKTGKYGEFLTALLLKQQELEGQKSSLQTQRAVASGAGYEAARAAAAGTRASMAGRQSEINNILGTFTPTTKTPELGKYTVDPATIRTQNSGLPNESSYYLSQILNKKKQQEVA